MAITAKSAEQSARCWNKGCSLAVREALENPLSQQRYDWALSFVGGNLPKLSRKGNGQARINVNRAVLRAAGLEGADRLLLLPLPEGGLLVQRATDEDVREARVRYTTAPQPCFPVKPALEELPEVEKLCPQCGLIFRTRQQRRVYCDGCRHQRILASQRVTWHRRGKLWPSYRRALRRTGRAGASHAREDESLTLPFGDETHGAAGTTTPAEAFPRS